jgi:hypothetical protein
MYGDLPSEEWNVSPRQTTVDREKSSHDGASHPQTAVAREDVNGPDLDADHRLAASNRLSKGKMRGEAKRLVSEENDERTLLLLPLLRALARCDIEAQAGESVARLLRE